MPEILQIVEPSRTTGKSRLSLVKRQLQHFSSQAILRPQHQQTHRHTHLHPHTHAHTHKMSSQSRAFLPCHSPIHPSTSLSNPLIWTVFLEHRQEIDDPLTSNELCLVSAAFSKRSHLNARLKIVRRTAKLYINIHKSYDGYFLGEATFDLFSTERR